MITDSSLRSTDKCMCHCQRLENVVCMWSYKIHCWLFFEQRFCHRILYIQLGPSICDVVFSGSALHFFWFFACCSDLINKLIFKKNSYYIRKIENGSFWGPKSMLLNFSQNLYITSLWNYTWWQVLKSEKSDYLYIKWKFLLCPKWGELVTLGP